VLDSPVGSIVPAVVTTVAAKNFLRVNLIGGIPFLT
jgi:hypothetical protein